MTIQITLTQDHAEHIAGFLSLGLSNGAYKDCVTGEDYPRRLVAMIHNKVKESVETQTSEHEGEKKP